MNGVEQHGNKSDWLFLRWTRPLKIFARQMALETRHVAVPTPLGRGYCGVGRCRWLLTDGQAGWAQPRLHN